MGEFDGRKRTWTIILTHNDFQFSFVYTFSKMWTFFDLFFPSLIQDPGSSDTSNAGDFSCQGF